MEKLIFERFNIVLIEYWSSKKVTNIHVGLKINKISLEYYDLEK
jgi:hypothetical protein